MSEVKLNDNLSLDLSILKKIKHLIDEFKDGYTIDTLVKIGSLFSKITWNENDENCVRNKHGIRSRHIKKCNSNNETGAKINFEVLSYMEKLNTAMRNMIFEQSFKIKNDLEVLAAKIEYVLEDYESGGNESSKGLSNEIELLYKLSAFNYIEHSSEAIVECLRSLRKKELNLLDKAQRFYLGHSFVTIGEYAGQMLVCLKPEVIDNEMCSKSLIGLLTALKEYRRRIKAHPDILFNMENDKVIAKMKTNFFKVEGLLEIFMHEVTKLFKTLIKDKVQDNALKRRFSEFDVVNESCLKQVKEMLVEGTKEEYESYITRIENLVNMPCIAKFKRVVTQIAVRYSEVLSIKSETFIEHSTMDKYSMEKLKVVWNNSLGTVNEIRDLCERYNSENEETKLSFLTYEEFFKFCENIKNNHKIENQNQIEKFSVSRLQIILTALESLNTEQSQFLKRILNKNENEIKSKERDKKLDSLVAELNRLRSSIEPFQSIDQLQKFIETLINEKNAISTSKLIGVLITETLYFDKLLSYDDNEIKNGAIKISFGIIGHFLKETFKAGHLQSLLDKYYQKDVLFKRANNRTTYLRSMIMHAKIDSEVINELFSFKYSSFIENVQAILYIYFYKTGNIKFIYKYYFHAAIQSFDDVTREMWIKLLLMASFDRLSAFNESIRIFESEFVQQNLQTSELKVNFYRFYLQSLPDAMGYDELSSKTRIVDSIAASENDLIIQKAVRLIRVILNYKDVGVDELIASEDFKAMLTYADSCLQNDEMDNASLLIDHIKQNFEEFNFDGTYKDYCAFEVLRLSGVYEKQSDRLSKALKIFKQAKQLLHENHNEFKRFLSSDFRYICALIDLEIAFLYLRKVTNTVFTAEEEVSSSLFKKHKTNLSKALDEALEHAIHAEENLIEDTDDLTIADIRIIKAMVFMLNKHEISKEQLQKLLEPAKRALTNEQYKTNDDDVLTLLMLIYDLIDDFKSAIQCFKFLKTSADKMSELCSKSVFKKLLRLKEANDQSLYSDLFDDSFMIHDLEQNLSRLDTVHEWVEQNVDCFNRDFDLNAFKAFYYYNKSLRNVMLLSQTDGDKDVNAIMTLSKWAVMSIDFAENSVILKNCAELFNAYYAAFLSLFKDKLPVNDEKIEVKVEKYMKKVEISLLSKMKNKKVLSSIEEDALFNIGVIYEHMNDEDGRLSWLKKFSYEGKWEILKDTYVNLFEYDGNYIDIHDYTDEEFTDEDVESLVSDHDSDDEYQVKKQRTEYRVHCSQK